VAEAKVAGTSPIKVALEKGKTYFFCTCGESSNQPYCDGSHSGTEFTPKAFDADRDGAHFLCACKQSANTPYCDGSHSKL